MGQNYLTRFQASGVWLLTLIACVFTTDVIAQKTNVQPANNELNIVKSPNDQRHYRYLELENSLKVVLISDSSAEKSAAALDVNVGSGDDPKNRAGLAHFLEHMLFLGTEKYPEAGEYQKFINRHSGRHNAYTSAENTNYFFNIDSDYFTQALDRFAQFFVAPLFTSDYVDRERHAVHSEYKAKIKNDYRRQIDVYRHIVNPEHPLSKFSVGSLATLTDRPDDSTRQALLNFYEDYYSADQMTLVVLGRESLDDLEKTVRAQFSAIIQRPTEALISHKRLFNDGVLPSEVFVKSIKNVRQLSLIFPVDSAKAYYRQKPLQYLGSLLGHEGEGSLLSLLKELGWAEGLSAGAVAAGRNQGSFNISITLTPEGLENRRKVVSTVFKMIDKIRLQGIEQWRFDEQKQLSDIAFRFAEKTDPINVVSTLANRLHHYPPKDLIRGVYAFDDYDVELMTRYLDRLNPNNVLSVITAQEVATDRTSSYYNTPYRIEPVNHVPEPLTAEQLDKLRLPKPNPFIPSQLAIKSAPANSNTADAPTLLRQNQRISVWHKQAVDFTVPRSVLKIRVLSPLIGPSVKSQASAHLFAALVNDSLNEFSYPAALAGLGFSVGANSRGLDVSVSGYSDRQELMLTRILAALNRGDFSKQRFDSLKVELMRKWRNSSEQPPYKQLMSQLQVALYLPLWSFSEQADAIESLTFEQLKNFANRVWVDADIKMLATGNLYAQEGLKLATIVETGLHPLSQATDDASSDMTLAQVVELENGVQERLFFNVDHQDVAAVYYVQALGDSIEDRAMTLLQQQMLRPSFFNQLRTEKQLGYLVFVSGMQLKDVAGTLFVVQSPALMLEDLEQEISAYVASKAGTVEDFEKNKQALIVALTQAPKNLGQQASRYWSEILSGSDHFTDRQRLIAAVEALTEEGYKRYSQKMLGDSRGLWMVASGKKTVSSQDDVIRNNFDVDGLEPKMTPEPEESSMIKGISSSFKVGRPTYTYP